MKKFGDLSPYKFTLPYASEIFGVYQPLLGWRSKRIQERIDKGYQHDTENVFRKLYTGLKGTFDIKLNADQFIEKINSITPAGLLPPRLETNSFLLDELHRALPPIEEYKDAVWARLLTRERLSKILNTVVIEQTMDWYRKSLASVRTVGTSEKSANQLVVEQVDRESVIAGYLLKLREAKAYGKLKDLFFGKESMLGELMATLEYDNPLDSIDPFTDLDRVGLSPIGIVHLYRQYFFEFDTFLGTPVNHVWLSPGASVELLEISTRRTFIERTTESTLETTLKTEKSATNQDEIADAVKQDNRSDTKFGMNANANQGWIGGSATASSSFSLDKTQQQAREVSHKHMRQQTEKLSTEIRNNFKSTFKTITEVTDTSSKRYVLANTGPNLINYELRRKMRQVGVQVQDIGTYLCWHAYVDDPGRQLGIAQLVHLAKSPEVGNTPPPEATPNPQNSVSEVPLDIPFVQTSEDKGDLDEGYRDGRETDEDFNEGDAETIQANFGGFTAICKEPDYQFDHIDFDYNGNDVEIEPRDVVEDPLGKITFGIHLKHVNFRNNPTVKVTAKVVWTPTPAKLAKIKAEDAQKVKDFNAKTQLEFEKAFVDAARERIKISSNIQSRKFEELREEERIVVYRSLVQDMLTRNIPMPDNRTHHVVSELLNSIFDVDKMLYFVAPEWWRPRLHRSRQILGDVRRPVDPVATPPKPPLSGESVHFEQVAKPLWKAGIFDLSYKATVGPPPISATETVAWGGLNESRDDNYYITEESAPARMGSSLGWLLQLDGDNLRNAFLNAPWVKAVMPIRPGKEQAAINWLERLHVEGSDGMDDDYVASATELATIPHSGSTVTIRDAIKELCRQVKAKHEASMKIGKFPADEINDDNKVSATPLDKVYEHGFYPNQGGFKLGVDGPFEICDQWIEILPTDQIVPVEVQYDPKTGRLL